MIDTDYRVHAEPVVEWGIGIFNDNGDLTRIRTRRERMLDRFQDVYTEETAKHDRAAWVGPNGAWAHHPDLIQVVSRLITPWRTAP